MGELMRRRMSGWISAFQSLYLFPRRSCSDSHPCSTFFMAMQTTSVEHASGCLSHGAAGLHRHQKAFRLTPSGDEQYTLARESG
jgi:hypothetical protein